MIRSDKPSEFRKIFDEEFGYVTRVLRRLGVRPADVEDLAQEVFVNAHRKFSEYDRSRPVRPWLFAFAFRVAANHQRLSRNSKEVLSEAASDTSMELVDASTPEQALTQRQQQELVLAALQHVPLDRRGALVMHDIDGFSAPDIAASLAIPVNTVSSRVRIARDEFKKALRRLQLRKGEP